MMLSSSIFELANRRDTMTDCLILGFNDTSFEEYVKMLRSMGTDSGAYRDLNLAFINYDNKPQRSMDILNHFYFEESVGKYKPFHNGDFLWPVITYLGTYLSRRGFDFDYINLPHVERDRLDEKLKRKDLLTIAITTTLYVSPQPILDLISFIKQRNDTAKIIVGGPYVSNQAKMTDGLSLQQMFRYLGADIYVLSTEGELALVNILKALKTGSGLDQVENIAYNDGRRFVFTERSTESNPLEENMVDYTLFPKEEIDQFVTLRTAKSCPFACAFCGFPQRAGKYTYTGVDLVEQELNSIRDLGSVTTLTFIDDTFNVPKGRFKDILRMMIKNRYGFKWNSYLRSDHADEEAIELMGEAGCEGVFLGVESGSDIMLEKMNKSSRRKDYLRVIPQLRDAGISQYTSIIVGFPGETYETVQETISFLEEAAPTFFRAQLWYCDPTTPIWNEREKYGVKGSAFNWSHDTMDVKTACDLIDRIFLSVENSTWLPQNGFEQWSTFYLQRKGMGLDRIKAFLTCFNAAVKEKLIYPDKEEVAPALLESLRMSSKFDKPVEPSMAPVEAFSAAGYLDAESFWAAEFSGEQAASNPESTSAAEGHGGAIRAYAPLEIESSTVDALEREFPENSFEAILAAYSLLLARTSGREEAVIVSAFGNEASDVVPLNLSPVWSISIRQLVQQVNERKRRALNHQRYAFHIVTNPLRMAQRGAAPPALEYGFLYAELEEGQQQPELKDALRYHRSVSENLALILEAHKRDGALSMRLSYLEAAFSRDAVEKLGSYFTSILEAVGKTPDSLINEILPDNIQRESDMLIQEDASRAFNF
jgi:radical SAM PhpK family P-methyltransferase